MPLIYLTENLSEFLVVSVFSSLVFWFLRGRRFGLLILSGIVIACSGLTRPTYQPLALVVAGVLLMARWMSGRKAISYRDCIRAGMVLLTTSVVLIGGFSLLNYVKFDFFGIYPSTGFNFSNRTMKFLERLPDQYAAEREALIKARNAQLIEGEDHTGIEYYWKALPELSKITGLASDTGAIAIFIASELDTDKKRTSPLSSRSSCIFFWLLVAVSHQSRKHEFPWHTNLVGSSPFRNLSAVYFAADRYYRARDIPDDSTFFCR